MLEPFYMSDYVFLLLGRNGFSRVVARGLPSARDSQCRLSDRFGMASFHPLRPSTRSAMRRNASALSNGGFAAGPSRQRSTEAV